MGTPDSPVVHRIWHCSASGACRVSWPLGFGVVDRWSPLSSCATGQSGGTPDRLVRSDFAALTSALCIVYCSQQSTIGRSWPLLRWLAGHMSGAHRTVWWIIAERLPENPRVASSRGALAGAPDSVRCTTGSTYTCLCSKLCRFPQLIFFVGLCWTLCTWDKGQLGKLVISRGLWWHQPPKSIM
jgi:hypothetical protein